MKRELIVGSLILVLIAATLTYAELTQAAALLLLGVFSLGGAVRAWQHIRKRYPR